MEKRSRSITDARQKMCPLSETQRGVWTYSIQHPQEPFYHIVLRLSCSPETDVARLVDAVCHVVNLHPVLKVTIGMDETGEMVMLRHDEDAPRVRMVSIREAERASLEQDFMRQLDVDNGELYRLLVVQTEQRPYLYASFHHVIFDGLSSSIFMGEVSAVYDGIPVEAETMDAFEVVARERERRQSSDYETARRWHESTFQPQDIRILPLPDVHRKQRRKTAYMTIPLSVTSAQLKELAQTSGHTPNIVTLSAFALLQGCFTGEGQARFTTLFHGRHGRNMMNTVGMLVQTLPVALRWQTDTPLDTLMFKASRQLQRSMVSDVHSFAEVVQTCGGFGDISFVYQGNTIRLSSFCGSSVVRPMLMPSLTGTKLGMELWDEGDGLEMRVEYDANSYSAELVKSMVSTYETILSSMASAATVSDVRYVNDDSLARLDAFNQDSSPFETAATVADLFREMAGRYPEAQAVIAEDRILTYRQLEELTDEWAARLQEKGVGAGSVVGIQVPRNSWMVVAPLAVLKTGAAYLPLLSVQPKAVTDELLAEAAADGLFTAEGFQPLKSCTCPRPPGLLALFYTSGSTGKPKAVGVTHQNLLAYCDWYQQYFHPKEGMVIGAYNQFAFDGSLTDIFPALLFGATVCIVPERIRKDIRLLEDFVNRHQVEILDLPTQVGRLFAAQTDCPSLQHIVLGGEAVAPVKPKGNYQLHNQYGPTETTVAVTVYPMTGDEAVVPIGKPLSHVKCYVVGNAGQRVSVGAVGELWVAGPQVALGYWKNETLTTKVFGENPFEGGEFHRLYRTGDYVRYLTDGTLEFIGRRDRMVKVRGYRVELEEIECAIGMIEGVDQVVATVCQHPKDGQSVVVYFTSSKAIDKKLIADKLRKEKPSYLIPDAIIQLDSLPLTPQGKIDRERLPEPSWLNAEHYLPPQGSLEILLCDVFAQVLEKEKVGADEDFFMIGGNSIKAMHVVSRLESAGIHIRYADIYSHPTPQLLAKSIAEPNSPKAYQDDVRQEEMISPAISHQPLTKDVLLTGATGFLGAHVLKELLLRGNRVICIVQPQMEISGRKRLTDVLHFYFGSSIDNIVDDNLQVIEGDLLSAELPSGIEHLTVVHCAALVKHFAPSEELRRVNVDGTMRLARYCQRQGHRFVHVSTLAKESNPYSLSKIEAEKQLLPLADEGLLLTIVRLGNLSPRLKDGVMPQKKHANTMIAWLRTILFIGCVPTEVMSLEVDFTPVDEAARGFLLLAETTGTNVFHLFNPQMISVGNIVEAMNKCGTKVENVSAAEFDRRLSSLVQQPEMAAQLVAALSHLDNSTIKKLSNHLGKNEKTQEWLLQNRFFWSVPTMDDLCRIIANLVKP